MSGGSMNYLHSRGEEVNTLCKAAKHMLEVADANQYAVANQAPHSDVMAYNAAVNNLRTALKQEEEASAWLAERKEHWRKEREKAQATKDQDPELSAALGWPGGISDPVLDRKTLLQMVAALRLASQQALEALQWHYRQGHSNTLGGFRLKIDEKALRGLRAALAQQAEPRNQCRSDGRCQYAIDHGAEGMGHCPKGKCVMAQHTQPAEDRDVAQSNLRLMKEMFREQAEPAQQVKTCAWRDNLDAIYETECGNLHIVNDGTLEENGMKYCCYCGKEIKDESPTNRRPAGAGGVGVGH